MSESTIKAQIKAILEGVTGLGVVHDRERYTRSLAAWRELVRSGGRINAGFIHRDACPTDRNTMPKMMRHHHFRLHFVYEMNDEGASEADFQDLLEDVFTAFKNNPQINGSCYNSEPLSIEEIGVMMEEDRLICHTAEALLICHEKIYYS